MPETPVHSRRSTTRRDFLNRVGGAVGAVGAPWLVPGSGFGADAPSNRVHVALIGCGNQSRGDLPGVMRYDDVQVTAVCDVNKGSYGYANGVELICQTQKPGFGVRFEGTEGWVLGPARGTLHRRRSQPNAPAALPRAMGLGRRPPILSQ